MADFGDVERLVAALPGTEEGSRHGHRTWGANGKGFAWERPFSKADIKRFGAEMPPSGPILAVNVDDESEKAASLAAHPEAVFTISHFNGYPAVLVQLDMVTDEVLAEVLLDGWLTVAAPEVAVEHLRSLGLDDDPDR